MSARPSLRNHMTYNSSRPVPRNALAIQLLGLTGLDGFGGIDSLFVELDVSHFAIFVDDECCPPGSFVLGIVQSVLFGDVTAPVAQQRKCNANFFSPSFIGER